MARCGINAVDAACLLLLAAVACTASPVLEPLLHTAQADPDAGFREWMAMHGKAYVPGSEEYTARYAAWLESVGVVAGHASRNDGPGYTLGLGPFADWTDEEFEAAYLSKVPALSASASNAAAAGGDQDDLPELRHVSAESLADELAGDNALLPSHVDWREAGIVGPIKDQHANGSKCGCCWAFATAAVVEMANAMYTGELVTLSEQQLIDCDRAGYDIGCGGGAFDTGVRYVIRNGGLDTDGDYPYMALDMQCQRKKERRHVVTVDALEMLPGDDEALLAKVVAKTPVVTAICCGPFITEWKLYTGGVFDPGNCTQPIDHALPIVGYGTEAGSDYWLIKNSWGAEWGDKGYIKVPRNVGGQGKFALAHAPGRVIKDSPNPGAVAKDAGAVADIA